tara:strand:- start:6352 stop:7560 length:1209 start_codon:yes stop_codon:yes gene_type:complete
MRISIVTDTFSPNLNGVAMTLERFSRGLLERGHGVHLISPVKAAGDSLTGFSGFYRYRTDRVPLPGYSGLRLGVPTSRKLRKIWKDNRPDIIYVATETAMGVTALRVARKREIPVASGFHTNFHSYSKDYSLPFLEDMATDYLRRVHNETDATFVPVEDVAEELRKEGFKNVQVLGRGVDTALFNPEKRRSKALRESWGVSPDDPVVLYVGRIAAEKNLDLFFKACDAMREKVPALKVVVVGDGPLLGNLKDAHPEVIFEGVKRDEELAACYASADLFPFPSTSETYGNVVVEALASGLQVVAFDYAAPAKFIEDGKNGHLCPMGDKEAFIAACLRAIENPAAPELRAAAVDSASGQSWDRVVSNFEAALEKIVAEYQPRGPISFDIDLKAPWGKDAKAGKK